MKAWYPVAVVLPMLCLWPVGAAWGQQELGTPGEPAPDCGGSNGRASLVRDINPGQGNSLPLFPADVRGRLFFGANDGVVGSELWVSDGTESGTHLVKDINPGADSGIVDPDINGIGAVSFRGKYFFPAQTPDTGLELWKSDGTAAGTVLVKDIRPGPARSEFGYLSPLGDRMVFAADDGVHGTELWVTDGTTRGTRLLEDIFPGPQTSLPFDLRVVGNRVFFAADDGVHGRELWVSNGTRSGTRLVEDILPGAASSNPFQFHELDGVLVFLAGSESGGFDVWRSDGTPGGTFRLKDLMASTSPVLTEGWTEERRHVVYFSAQDSETGWELWVTDGTPRGTRRVADILPGSGSSFPNGLTRIGRTVFFSADDGVSGFELWKSNGSSGGTQRVKDIWPGPDSGIGGLTAPGGEGSFFPVGNRILFGADDGVHGRELWVSNGKESGTLMLQDIFPGPESSFPGPILLSGNQIFFVARDGIHGAELWAIPKHDVCGHSAQETGETGAPP